jgi:uncharacterized spore protein YtfJ
MNIQQLLQGMVERVSASASVKNVYGEPVAVGSRTVIHAAQIRYGFGGGGGSKGEQESGVAEGRCLGAPIRCPGNHARGHAVHQVR